VIHSVPLRIIMARKTPFFLLHFTVRETGTMVRDRSRSQLEGATCTSSPVPVDPALRHFLYLLDFSTWTHVTSLFCASQQDPYNER